jgi:hypothetical protein
MHTIEITPSRLISHVKFKGISPFSPFPLTFVFFVNNLLNHINMKSN